MFQILINTMPMFVCGILSVELVLALLGKFDRPRCWLLAWSVVCTVLYACHMLYFHREHWAYPYSDIVYIACNLAVYPLYLFYISELTEPKPLSRRPLWLALLLAIPLLAATVAAVLYGAMSAEETQDFLFGYFYHDGRQAASTPLLQAQDVWHLVCRLLFAVQVVMVLVLSLRKIKRYNRMVELYYADAEERKLHSLRWGLLLLVVMSLLSLLANSVGRHVFVDTLWLVLPSLGFSLMLLFIGYTGLQMRFSVYDMSESALVSTLSAKGHDEPMTASRYANLQERFLTLMAEEKLYLQPDLRLDEVARRLGTNRTYLLAMLNEQLQMTFSEYVNRQRIAYAEQLMANNPEMNKVEVSMQSGYGSPASFYRNFKLYRSSKA